MSYSGCFQALVSRTKRSCSDVFGDLSAVFPSCLETGVSANGYGMTLLLTVTAVAVRGVRRASRRCAPSCSLASAGCAAQRRSWESWSSRCPRWGRVWGRGAGQCGRTHLERCACPSGHAALVSHDSHTSWQGSCLISCDSSLEVMHCCAGWLTRPVIVPVIM